MSSRAEKVLWRLFSVQLHFVLFCCGIIFLLLKLNDHFIQQGIRKSVYDIREIMEAVLRLMISFLYECKINLFHNIHVVHPSYWYTESRNIL